MIDGVLTTCSSGYHHWNIGVDGGNPCGRVHLSDHPERKKR